MFDLPPQTVVLARVVTGPAVTPDSDLFCRILAGPRPNLPLSSNW